MNTPKEIYEYTGCKRLTPKDCHILFRHYKRQVSEFIYTRKVFDIVKTLFFSKQEYPFYSRTNLVKNMIKYISENNFPQDSSLKSDKDIFINDYLESCEAWKIDNEFEKFSKYLEKNYK